MEKVFVGTELYNCADVSELNSCHQEQVRFHGNSFSSSQKSKIAASRRALATIEPLTRSDKMLGSDKWTTSIVVRFRIGFVLIRQTKM